jgi:N-acetylneuraminate lyase
MAIQQLHGLIAAAHSPFDASGALQLSVVEQQAAFFREMDLIGVFVGGSTGEWFSLTIDERRALIEAWSAHASGLVLIAHVGGVAVKDAQALAAHAESLGVDAVSCLVQPDAGIETAEQAIDYLEAVASAAPNTSAFYYDMPTVTGVDVPLDVLLKAAMARVPTLAGAKFTHTDLATLTRAMQVSSTLQVLMGRDEMLLGALATGVTAAVGSTYNYAAPAYQRIINAVERGDLAEAQRANVEVVQFIEALVEAGVLQGGKAIMGWMGVNVGEPRPPYEQFDKEPFHATVAGMPVFARPLSTCH